MAGKTKWMFEGRSYGKWINKGRNGLAGTGSMMWQFTIFGKVMASIYRSKRFDHYEYVVFFTYDQGHDAVKKFKTLNDAKEYVQDHIGGYA